MVIKYSEKPLVSTADIQNLWMLNMVFLALWYSVRLLLHPELMFAGFFLSNFPYRETHDWVAIRWLTCVIEKM